MEVDAKMKMQCLANWSIEGILLILITVGCSNNSAITYTGGAVPPAEAAETYHVAEGFQVQLIASEPVVEDPTDMAVDEDGRMYVVEMNGYPLEMNHTGTIKLLRDSDGDGVMDASVLFADHLMFPNGVLPWKGGVLVTDAPYVVYLKDTDHDGRANIRDTLLAGFSLSNPHVNVNNPVYGLDNWVHLAHFGSTGEKIYNDQFGDKGRKITFWGDPNGPQLPKNANSKNVRFKPGEKKLQMLSSKSQFGHTFNAWGDYFLTNNQNHIYEEALKAPYLNRNPNLLISDATQIISDHGKQGVIYPIKKDQEGQIIKRRQTTTSSSGITYYSGGLFPPPYNNHTTFVAESAFSLVHTDKLTPDGATFQASRMQKEKDFLASTDEWASPANMYIGPDGALYVLDYYRQIIEHPEWLSKEARESGNLYKGQKMGRIYRITPNGTPAAAWTTGLELGEATSTELAGHLSDKNSWWRLNAQRLLVARGDQDVVPLLEEKAVEDPSAFGRLHSLWTLEGLDALPVGIIENALQDKVAGVRRNAIQLAEKYMDQSDALRQRLYAMADDSDSKVRYQLLNTLGYLKREQAWQVRKNLLVRDMDDPWVRRLALTAADVKPNRLLKAVTGRYEKDNSNAYLSMVQHLSTLIGEKKGGQQQITKLIRSATRTEKGQDHNLQSAILAGLAIGLPRNKEHDLLIEGEENRLINTFFNHPSNSVRNYSLQLLQRGGEASDDQAIQKGAHKALEKVQDDALPGRERGQMLEFLTLTDPSPYLAQIEALIANTEESEVQQAAITVLGQMPGTEFAQYLAENWKLIQSPAKNRALDIFLDNKDRASILLHALKGGRIPTRDLGGSFRAQLVHYDNKEIQEKANELLASDTGEEIPQRYKKALTLSGDIGNGSEIFERHCSTCHQLKGAMGGDYGPDLGTVSGWSKKDIMSNILSPGASITQNFELWELNLKDGKSLTGIIKSESDNAIELQTGPQSKRTINRDNVKKMEAIEGASAMPPGFAGRLTPQKMADLMAFIKKSLD